MSLLNKKNLQKANVYILNDSVLVIKNIFQIKYLFWFILGCALTYFMVIFNIDWKYFIFIRELSHSILLFLESSFVLGFFIPILGPVIFFILYFFNKSRKALTLLKLLTFSAALGWFLSSIIKAFTGRAHPDIYNLLIDNSHIFNFGFFKYGVFWGWPSSHTTVAFSTSIALFIFLKHKHFHFSNFSKKIISLILVIYPCYIAIGVSSSGHWITDALMGAILGTIIGIEVGKYYLSHHF